MGIGFRRIINKIQKAGYNVSICKCSILDDGEVKYSAYDGTTLCVYCNNNDELIEKIERIAKTMKYRTMIKYGRFTTELFIR